MTKTTQQIPAGWENGKFNEFIELLYGSNLPKTKREKGSMPVYGSNGITDHHSESLIEGPGIIVGRKGSIGLVHWSKEAFWPIDTTYYVNKKGNTNLKWVYYMLQILGLKKMNTASGIPGLNRNEVYSLQISVPPLSEQTRIATILSKVDEEIKKVEQIIEQTEKLKKGLMQKLLTKGIGHKKFKKTEIGEIPEKWEMVNLKDKSKSIQYGYTESAKNEEVGPKFLRITDIVDGQVKWNDVPYCRCKETEKYQLQNGDIVFARTGATTGKSFYIENPPLSVFASYLIRVTVSQEFVSKFVYYFFQSSQYWNQINSSISGSAQGGVNASKLGNLKLPLPTFNEQKQIIERLSATDSKISINQKLKSHFITLKKGLMNDLLSGKVRTIL